MIAYIENPKDSTQKLLELINSVSLQNTKSRYKNPLFYTLTTYNNVYQKEKLRKQSHLQMH